jgi:hypothetical protein
LRRRCTIQSQPFTEFQSLNETNFEGPNLVSQNGSEAIIGMAGCLKGFFLWVNITVILFGWSLADGGYNDSCTASEEDGTSRPNDSVRLSASPGVGIGGIKEIGFLRDETRLGTPNSCHMAGAAMCGSFVELWNGAKSRDRR